MSFITYLNNLSHWKFYARPISFFNLITTRGAKIVHPKNAIRFWKIKPGDKVVVISGKDKGKVDEVLMCDKLRNQVKVKGCNMRKLTVNSQLVQIEKKIHYSNVQLVDPLLKYVTASKLTECVQIRVSKKSGYVIPWPAKVDKEKKEYIEGEKDTKPEIALMKTYNYKKDLLSMQLLRQTMEKYNREL